MSAADVWRVLRANAWLISAGLVVSIIVGFIAYELLLRYYPKYTATAIVAVSPPVQLDPLKVGQETVNTSVLVMEQQNNAQLLKQQRLYSEVLEDPNSPVRDTAWLRQYNGNNPLAERDLMDYLLVTPVQDTNQIRVEFGAASSQDAIKIIESVVDQLMDDESKQNAAEQQSRSMQLTAMLQRLEQRRTDTVDDMHDKEVHLNISGVEGSGRLNVKETALEDLTKERMDAELRFALAKEDYNDLESKIKAGEDPPAVQMAVNEDPNVQRYKELVQDRDLRIMGLKDNYGAAYEQVKELQDEKEMFDKKEAQAEQDVRQATRVAALDQARRAQDSAQLSQDRVNQEIASLETDIQNLNRDLGDYQSDKDQLTGIDAQEKEIKDQLDQIAQFTAQKDQTNLEWASHPAASEIPTFPRLGVTMTMAILLGLGLSLGIAFLRESLDTTVRSPRDITRIGNLPMLGIIPHEDDDPQSTGASLPMVIFDAPQSMIAEHLRQVRTRLQHAASLDTTRTILITSPSPNDGKTTIACNLASGLALNGRRILLVDANFRRPAIHKVFNIANDVGFSDVLNKVDLLPSAVQPTQVPNLFVLPSGTKPTNATELMESQLLADFIERAVEEYDHIIFDSGPLLLSSETAALAPRVDGVVTVVRAQSNSRGLLQRLRDTLRQIKAEHLGVVLNAVRSQGGGYYRSTMRTYYDYQNGHAA